MARLASLSVDINADTSAAEKAIEKNISGAGLKAGKAAGKSASQTFVGAFDNTAVKIGAAALGALAAREIGKAISSASAISEAQNKVNTIFQDGADDVRTFAETAAKEIGQSKIAVFEAAGTFGTFGKSAGLAGKDLASFAERFTGLSSDLASFYNTSPEDAVQAIGAAFRGEAEPIRKYGILLDDATLRQEALALGLIKTTKEALTPQQKVLAASESIFKQTADAQGDFARTSDGLANQQRILTAEFENTRAEVGEAFLPIALKATEWARGALAAFGALPDGVQAGALAVGVLGAALVLAVPPLVNFVKAVPAFVAGVKLISTTILTSLGPVGLVIAGVGALVSALVVFDSKSKETARNAAALREAFDAEPNVDNYAAVKASLGELGANIERNSRIAREFSKDANSVGDNFRALGMAIGGVFGDNALEADRKEWEANLKIVQQYDQIISDVGFSTGATREAITRATVENYDNSKSWLENKDAIEGVVRSQFQGTKSGAALAEASATAADAAADATEKTDALRAALDALNGVTLSENDAQRGYQAALDEVAGSIKENGLTLDVNSEKGRANAEVLDSIAQAALDYGQAIIDTDGDNKRAIETLEASRTALFKQARQFFKTDEATQAYVDSVLSIPEEWTTDVDIDTKDAVDGIDFLINKYDNTRIRLVPTIDGNRLPSTIVNPKYLSGNANGGFVRAGEPTLVGEAGVEVFTPDRDGYIVPNYALREAGTTPSGSGGTTDVRVFIGDRELTDIVRVEVNERDEQMALALAGAR